MSVVVIVMVNQVSHWMKLSLVTNGIASYPLEPEHGGASGSLRSPDGRSQ